MGIFIISESSFSKQEVLGRSSSQRFERGSKAMTSLLFLSFLSLFLHSVRPTSPSESSWALPMRPHSPTFKNRQVSFLSVDLFSLGDQIASTLPETSSFESEVNSKVPLNLFPEKSKGNQYLSSCHICSYGILSASNHLRTPSLLEEMYLLS